MLIRLLRCRFFLSPQRKSPSLTGSDARGCGTSDKVTKAFEVHQPP
jgi:hypothetical protein